MKKQKPQISDEERELLDVLAELIAIEILKNIKKDGEGKDEQK